MEVKDAAHQFSFHDYLAYLFPGVTGTAAIYVLLLLTPLNNALANIQFDLAGGVLFLILSYVIGILLSVLSSPLFDVLLKLRGMREPRASIPVEKHKAAIISAYADIFNMSTEEVEQQWSEEHFFLCRSLVSKYMPHAANWAYRQSGVGNIRQYLIAPVLMWFVVGACCGILGITNGLILWGTGAIAASMILTALVIAGLVNKAYANKKREVREILMAFLIGYRQDLFGDQNKKRERFVRFSWHF